ncbi:unnamed protein product, partial [Amoebophrya sp. A25]
ERAAADTATEEADQSERTCSDMIASIELIKKETQAELSKAMPALELRRALVTLYKLKTDHLREVRAFFNPPNGVRITMEVLCQIFQIPPVRRAVDTGEQQAPGNKAGGSSRTELDYWEAAQKSVLADPKKLLDTLMSYDKDTFASDKIVKILEPYMKREDFEP